MPDQVAQGLSPRAYIYTDRPAYRPGQEVSLRGRRPRGRGRPVRQRARAVYRFEVADSRGRLIVARPVTLSDFGTFHESLPLDSGAPLGTYRVRLSQPGKSVFSGSFEVQSYQLEPIDLRFDLKQVGRLPRRDGQGRRGRPLPVRRAAGRRGRSRSACPTAARCTGRPTPAGKYHVEFSTEGFAEEQTLRLAARLPQDNVAAVGGGPAGGPRLRDRPEHRPATSTSTASRSRSRSSPRDAQGKPIGESLSATLVKQVTSRGPGHRARRLAQARSRPTPRPGKASLTFRADDAQGGRYVLRVAGTDRFGNPIVADRAIYDLGQEGRDQAPAAGRPPVVQGRRGGRASTCTAAAGPARRCSTWEADRILSYRLVTLKEGDNPVAWAVDGAQFPNFTLTVDADVARTQFDEARLDIRVERDLRVTVKPAKPTVGPGEPVELEVTTVDQLGRPVSAELVDRDGRPVAAAAVPRPAAADRPVLLRPDPHRGVRDRGDQHLPLRADTRPGLRRPSSRRPSGAAAHGRPTPPTGARSWKRRKARSRPSSARRPAHDCRQAGRCRPGGHGQVAGQGPTSAARLRTAATPAGDRRGTPEAAIRRHRRTAGRCAGRARPRPARTIEAKDSRTSLVDEDRRAEVIRRRLAFVARRIERRLSTSLGKPGRARPASRAVRRDGLLEPQRRHRQGRQGPRHLQGADGPVGVPVHGAGRHRAPTRWPARRPPSLTVRKNFFVDLKVPGSLTQGDKPRFIAQVHHAGIAGRVALRLAIYAGGRDDVFPRTLELKGDGVEEVLFEPFEVPDGDSVRLTLTGTVGEVKDELVIEVPIRPWGVQVFASASGTASDDATVFVGLPAGPDVREPRDADHVSPTLRRHADRAGPRRRRLAGRCPV